MGFCSTYISGWGRGTTALRKDCRGSKQLVPSHKAKRKKKENAVHIRTPWEWLFGQTTALNVVGSAPEAQYWQAAKTLGAPTVRKISPADLNIALRQGLQDFAVARTDVAALCLIYPVIGVVLAIVTARGGLLPLLFPIASGFTLVGPFAAIGLYEISRRREAYGNANWFSAFSVIRSPAIGRIALLGAVLIALFVLWLAVAMAIYDTTLGPLPPASVGAFITALFTTPSGWAMIGLGFAVGAVFAVIVLAISVVTFPLLLDRPVSLQTAIVTSVYALRRNPVTLLLWGVIVAAGLVLGSLPCFLGLIVVLPILGHATWHLYRRVVRRN